MQKTERLNSFYQDNFKQSVSELSTDRMNFNLFRFDDCAASATIHYRRRDYFKVAFLTVDLTRSEVS